MNVKKFDPVESDSTVAFRLSYKSVVGFNHYSYELKKNSVVKSWKRGISTSSEELPLNEIDSVVEHDGHPIDLSPNIRFVFFAVTAGLIIFFSQIQNVVPLLAPVLFVIAIVRIVFDFPWYLSRRWIAICDREGYERMYVFKDEKNASEYDEFVISLKSRLQS